MAKSNQQQEQQPTQEYRYVCHGCTNTAGYFTQAKANHVVICPSCGMDQLTKLENFIAL